MSIDLENVSFVYMRGTPFEHRALDCVSLRIEKGEFVALVGHTGSGKSTLIQQMNGLLCPSSGRVVVDGTVLGADVKSTKLARRKVGMVFQYPEHQLFAETVFEDVAFGPRNLGLGADETEVRVREALEFVGLDFDAFSQRNPLQLSGGQMRRVAIAGVVAMNPDYLILDEPSAGLDPRSRRAVLRQVKELHRKRGSAVVLVTHSMDEAVTLADRLLVVAEGKIAFDGSPAEIFRAHRQELAGLGLEEPAAYRLARLLSERGLKVGPEPDPVLLAKAIRKAKGWR